MGVNLYQCNDVILCYVRLHVQRKQIILSTSVFDSCLLFQQPPDAPSASYEIFGMPAFLPAFGSFLRDTETQTQYCE